jgi:hypothetical protein
MEASHEEWHSARFIIDIRDFQSFFHWRAASRASARPGAHATHGMEQLESLCRKN